MAERSSSKQGVIIDLKGSIIIPGPTIGFKVRKMTTPDIEKEFTRLTYEREFDAIFGPPPEYTKDVWNIAKPRLNTNTIKSKAIILSHTPKNWAYNMWVDNFPIDPRTEIETPNPPNYLEAKELISKL